MFTQAKEWEKPVSLLHEMTERGRIDPRPETYNFVVEACARGGNHKMAVAVIKNALKKGGTVDVPKAAELAIEACIQANDLKTACDFLQALPPGKVKEPTVERLRRTCEEAGQVDMITKALQPKP